jgi:hypothetical protein
MNILRESREYIDFLSLHGRGCIAVLYAYLDESGTHAGAPVLCVAGYVGNRKQWLAFDKEWLPKLKDSGISSFHAVESECDRLRLPLASAIVDKGNFMGTICSVKPDIYNTYATQELKNSMGNAYAACAVSCAWVICDYAYRNNLGPVTFVYEIGQPNADFVVRAIKTLALHKDPEMNIVGVSLGRKEECVPLAAADFLSHVYGSSSYDKNSVDWYNYLVRTKKIYLTKLTPEQLVNMSKISNEYIDEKRSLKELKRIMRFKAKYAHKIDNTTEPQDTDDTIKDDQF